MASVEKFKDAAALKILRHNKRMVKHPKNLDIDPNRSMLNYSLTPERGMEVYEYYKQRKAELYYYRRDDVKTLAGWVVTAPEDVNGKEQERAFFEATYDFLAARYGLENVIAADVHYDEGIKETIKDRFGTPILDENGKKQYKIVCGRPHLHFCFIPVAPDQNPNHIQSEKICASEVLTRRELRRFHPELNVYLRKCGITATVTNGRTRAQGGNRSVTQLKTETREKMRRSERGREIDRWTR